MDADSLVFKIVTYILEQDKATPEQLASEFGSTPSAVEQVCNNLMQAGFLFKRFGKYRFNYDHKDVAPLVKYSKKSGNRQELQEMVLSLVTGALSPLQSVEVTIEPETAPVPEPPIPEPLPAPKPPKVEVPEAPREKPVLETPEEPEPIEEPEEVPTPEPEEPAPEETPPEPAPKPEKSKKAETPAPEPAEPIPEPTPVKPGIPKHIEKALKDSKRMKEEVAGMRENLEEFKHANPMLDADAKENLFGHLRLKIDDILGQYKRETAEQLVKEFVDMQVIHLNGTAYNSGAEIENMLPRLTDEHLQMILERMRQYLKRRFAAKSMKKE